VRKRKTLGPDKAQKILPPEKESFSTNPIFLQFDPTDAEQIYKVK
jgi:hypothetical protein